MDSQRFISRYRNNLAWLESGAGSEVTYDLQGKFLTLEADDEELLFLLAERYGCFFSGEKAASSRRVKIEKNKGRFIFTDPSGKLSFCRHPGEVLYPCLAQTFDEIYETLEDHLVLHGSACATGAEGILFLGKTGAGKTSLLLEMIKRGFSYLSDDVSIVEMSKGKTLTPNPLGFKLREPVPDPGGMERHNYLSPFHIENLAISPPCPLSAVVLLTDREASHHEARPFFVSEYEDLLSEFIIPPSKRKFYLGRLGAFFDKIPFRVMWASKKIPVEKKVQAVVDWLGSLSLRT